MQEPTVGRQSGDPYAGLRPAFAAEVARRLPRLAELERRREPDLVAEAHRDAHSLASSAFVLGERAAGATARELEELLSGAVAGGELDPDRLRGLVRLLEEQLAGWAT